MNVSRHIFTTGEARPPKHRVIYGLWHGFAALIVIDVIRTYECRRASKVAQVETLEVGNRRTKDAAKLIGCTGDVDGE